jgi:hypothetical protein
VPAELFSREIVNGLSSARVTNLLDMVGLLMPDEQASGDGPNSAGPLGSMSMT